MNELPTFEDYVASLGRLTAHVDPTLTSDEALEIKAAAASLADLSTISVQTLTAWATANPTWIPVLGLSIGLSQEKLKNTLKHRFGTASWLILGRTIPQELIKTLDEDFDLVRLIITQAGRSYDFGDILVARAGTRRTAVSAGASGRKLEDEIELIADELGLPSVTRTRFVGRNGRTAPCDLAIPTQQSAAIIVAAKGFDSTGSKLTDAVREIEQIADIRRPTQFVMAVIDGIGWKSRISDLRRIYSLWANQQIDGMYTLASLDSFRRDLENAARLRHLL